ncbi:hypothetical protein [Thermus sp.]|jgi:hypothetical protein|uniref:hypothetical protein n=1 Tax=Thermus sp. TaxID=275 RepID=UPI003D09AC97
MVFIQRKVNGEEVIQVIPREALVMVELLGQKVRVQTTGGVVEVRVKPEHLDPIKASLFAFATGQILWLKEVEE